MTANQTRSKFIDFQQLKHEIKIEDAMPLLGLQFSQFSDQMRMPCPACKSGGDRALVITKSKRAFYCFAKGEGGDVIGLIAHVNGISMKDAANVLAESFNKKQKPKLAAPVETVPSNSSPKKEKAGLNPLTYLQPEHPLVQALGISPETAKAFGAGYAPKGIMRGRFAMPIHDATGVLVAYCGQAVSGESPALIFPNGFQPSEFIFNAYSVHAGPLALVLGPLQVLKAFEAGIENVVAFLSETITAQQLEMLASLMDQMGCETLEQF
jgi:DNA primase